ncbi:MAG: S8 family serine peptidase [Agathobacter sp.]|nr:S8 family serine peptidase [Agathobacter sp.]
MGRKRKLVAILVVICMFATMLPSVPITEYEASEKVGSELMELMNITYEDLTSGNYLDSGETYSCIIWIEDVEIEEAVEAGIDAAEMTRDDYSTWSMYDYPYTTYEADGLTYVDVEFDETESDEYVQTYIEAEREAAVEMYSASNSSFVAENFMARDMSVTYVSKYSPCIFADLSVTKIAELIKQSDVVCIEYWDDGEIVSEGGYRELSDAEIKEHIEVIRSDEATDIYGATGEGIKIGQIEPGCSAYDAVISTDKYDNVLVQGEYDYHADNVYKIMSMVAPDAMYYGVGMYDSSTSAIPGNFYERVEWLLDQGVNIINMSAGYVGESVVNQYTARARWVDHIAYNHDVHFVISSGNTMHLTGVQEVLQGVSCPGMAYNVITVGNTYSTAEEKYLIHESSSYNHNGDSSTTYKPDIVAPGTYYNEDGTVDEYSSGTSFSAPLVTGTIALMCEYRPALKTKQHIVKAILAATTSKSIYRYVTTNSNFEIYGTGMLDARSALYALYVGDYVNYTGELKTLGASRSYKMSVTSSDTYMRVALAYANRIKFDSDDSTHADSNTPSGEIGKLGLEVYDPNGNLVAHLYSRELERNANLKVLQFNTNGVTGNYTIKVIVEEATSDGRVINFGVAWR